MFGSATKMSSAAGNATSGYGAFVPENESYYKKPMIDFSEPLQVIALISIMVISIYAYKRIY